MSALLLVLLPPRLLVLTSSSLLSHINSSLVRPEYKLKVYTSYALPSLRFHLTIHDLTKTQLSSLDALSTSFLKSWLSIPPCATTSVFYYPLSLNLYTMPSYCSECHDLSQGKLALSPDPLVRSALEYKRKQSSSFAKKLSSVTQTNKLVSPILESSCHLSPSQ